MDAHHHGDMPGLAAPELAHHNVVDLPPLGAAAGPAGLSKPPHKSEPPGVQAEGFRGQRQDDRPDSPPTLAIDQAGATDTKRFATLRARLALKGWALSRTDAGDGPVTFYATRWGMARDLASIDAVAEFADRVGAPR